MKITTITPEQEPEHRNRKGFTSVCCYGDIKPETGEIGGIFRYVSNARYDRGLAMLLYEAQCVERIFVTPNH